MMQLLKVENLATLRAVVGYLGEKEQHGWWQSSFFGPGSSAFLSPVFGRTASLAQLTAVTNAAAQIHDEYIGIGDTYHLFRLPEELEQAIHVFLTDPHQSQSLRIQIKNRETASAYLEEVSKSPQAGIGPTYIGNVEAIRSAVAWEIAATHYANAFAQSTLAFPYFADRTG
jgi:hypothetical protein